MDKEKNNVLHLGKFSINALLCYVVFHLSYLILAKIIFQFKLSGFIESGLTVFLTSSLRDFQNLTPQHYLFAFVLSKVLAVLVVLMLSYFLFHFLKKREVNLKTGLNKVIKVQLLILFSTLIFYLVLYFLARIYLGSRVDFFIIQSILTKGFLFQLILQAGIIVINYKLELAYFFKNYLFQPVLPFNIAILRIFFFIYLARIYINFNFKFSPTIEFGEKTALPFLGSLIDLIPVNTTLYGIFTIIGVVCCLFIVVGYKTKYFLIINAICCFYLIATPNFFGKLWHFQILIWISWFLAFAKCYDVFSVDSYLSKKEPVKSVAYSFPIRFIWLQFGVIYFWAGFYKLWDAGFDWALNKTMINQVQLEWLQNYDKIPSVRIDNYPLFLNASGFAVILFELSFFFILFTKYGRWIVGLGGFIMHAFIGYFMYISFFINFVIFYVFFIDFNSFFKKKEASIKTVSNTKISKWAVYSSLFILSMNFLAGMFNIDTYPFSAYPKYAATIPDEIEIIHFKTFSKNLNVHEIGANNNFRWEDYGWVENNIIQDFNNGINVNDRIKGYWNIWVGHNSELKGMDSIQCSVIKRPVAPSGRYHYSNSGPVYSFVPEY